MEKKIKIRSGVHLIPHQPQLTSGSWKNQGAISPARARDWNESGHVVFELYRFQGFSCFKHSVCSGYTGVV